MRKKMYLREKIGFALTNLGNIPIMTLLNTYLLIFYTDVIGINPAVVATLFLVSRMFDGISDPILGYFIDKFPQTRLGKYRVILVLGTIVCCINYLFVWFAPLLLVQHQVLVIGISYLLLGVTFDLMDIPLNSMIPILTKDENERNVLSSIKGVSYTVGPTILNVLAPLAIAAFTDKTDGYLLLIIGTVLTVLFFTIVGAACLKERNLEAEEPEKAAVHYSFKDIIAIFKIRSVSVLFVSMLFVTAATNIFNGTILYYITYLLGDERIFSMASLVGFFGALFAGMIVPSVSKRIGKENVYILGLFIASCMMVAILFFRQQVILFIVFYLFIQFGLGLINTIQYSISADNVDRVYETMHIQSAGLIASLNSFVMKVAMALGGAAPGFILNHFGYVSNQDQSPEAQTGILLAAFIVPFILYIITILVFKIGYKNIEAGKLTTVVDKVD